MQQRLISFTTQLPGDSTGYLYTDPTSSVYRDAAIYRYVLIAHVRKQRRALFATCARLRRWTQNINVPSSTLFDQRLRASA
jgi:hypothetical protein